MQVERWKLKQLLLVMHAHACSDLPNIRSCFKAFKTSETEKYNLKRKLTIFQTKEEVFHATLILILVAKIQTYLMYTFAC